MNAQMNVIFLDTLIWIYLCPLMTTTCLSRQFLINYANEVLQNQFNQFVFDMEQAVYAKEKIRYYENIL